MRAATLLLGLIALLPAVGHADVTVPLGHGKVNLPVPAGYCAADTERGRDSALFDFEVKSLDGRGRLLAVAADCTELEAYRERGLPIKRLAIFTAALNDGDLIHRPDAERAKFIEDAARDAGKLGPRDPSAFNMQWWNSFNANAQVQLFDVAGRDENAAYLRMVRVTGSGSQKISVASVWALTATGGYELAVNFYERGDEGTIAGLLATAKHEAAQLVAANPPVQAPPPPPPAVTADQAAADAGQNLPTLGTVLSGSSSTIMMAAGGVLVLGFLVLVASRRSPPKPKPEGPAVGRRRAEQ
jgi:hypothetical protein